MTQMRPGVLSGAMSPYPTVEKVTYAKERWGVKLKGQCLDGNSEVIPLTMTNQKASKKLRFSSPSDLLKRCSDGEKLQSARGRPLPVQVLYATRGGEQDAKDGHDQIDEVLRGHRGVRR